MRKLLLPLLITSIISAQTPPAPAAPAQQATPVIKVTTHIVQVSVVVHDKKGEPIADLKKEDFTLADKGQEQQIKFFSMESSKPAVADAAAPARRLPAGAVSNFLAPANGRPMIRPNAVTVILLDGLNSRFQDQHAAKAGLIKFLQQIQPGDQVALYSLGNGLKILHDFTTDTASLLRAMDRFKAGSSWALDASTPTDANTGNDDMDDFLNGADDKINTFYTSRRIETTLAALSAIAEHLSGLPGRKNLIWLSGGFPRFVGTNADGSVGQDFQSYGDQLQNTLRAVSSSGISIYPVDSRGLMGATDLMPSMSAASRTATRGGRVQNPGESRGDQRARDNVMQTQSTMNEIADRTGGRAFINSNDITGAIRRAISDTQISYVLGYSPTHNEWDGKFREIKVKVNRPGVEVRYRKGYFALPETPTDDKARQLAAFNAANSPLLATGIGMTAILLDNPPPDPGTVKVRMVMETKDISFTKDDKGMWVADLDLLLVERDAKGAPVHQLSRGMHLSLKQDQYDAFQKVGIGLNMTLELKPGAIRVRAVTRDLSTGAVGSLDLPLPKQS